MNFNTLNRLSLAISVLLLLSFSGQAQTGPAGVNSGLILWLDASDPNADGTSPASGSTFSAWKDKSGLGHDASSFGSVLPTFNANRINGNSAITFTRVSNLSGTGFQVPAVDIRGSTYPQVTIFTVYRQGTSFPGYQQAVWGDDNGGWDRFFFTKFTYTGAGPNDGGVSFGMGGSQTVQIVRNSGGPGLVQLLTATYNGSGTSVPGPANGSSIYFNGQLVTNFTDRTDPANAQTAMRIGLDGDDNYFDGEIAEVLVYDRLLLQCDIEAVNHYLSGKYGTGYDVAVNYSNLSPLIDIKGVGNFSTSCITNVINSASSSIVTIANPAVSTSGNNLTFANDAGGFATSTDVPSGYKTRLQQLWRTDEKGDVGTVDVTFDLTGLGFSMQDPGNFDLLVSSSSTFSSGTALTPTSRTVSGNTVTFTGVTLPKGDYFTLSLLRTAPSAAVSSVTDDTGLSNSDLITNDASLTINGTATPGSVVTLRANSTVWGTSTADASGNWSVAKTLSEGTYSLYADVALNGFSVTGATAKTLVIDLTPPDAPGAPVIPGLHDGYTNTGSFTLTGKAEPGSTVTIYDKGVQIGTANVDASGDWSYAVTPALSGSEHAFTATATDVAGNTSSPSPGATCTIDTQSPSVKISIPDKTVNAPFTATITFSEKVGGLNITDINIVNATLSDLVRVNDSVYTVLVTPVSESDVTLSIPAGVTKDAAGNGNTASSAESVGVTFDAVVDQIYPVPARKDLHIRFTGIAPEEGRVVLIDMAGYYVYDKQVQLRGQLLTINVSAYSAGTYILRVQARNYTYRTKVLIAH